MSGRVLIVAKAPTPGRSKTRLVPPLTTSEAATLQTALLLDTIAGCRAETDDVALLHPPGDEHALRRIAGPGVGLFAQEGAGLADALALGIARHTRSGPVAIVSSDIPGVPVGAITETFRALGDGTDVVLGPSEDGGYWLIAMREPHDAPFQGIPWSTPACLSVTIDRATDAGLTVRLLQRWRDVDTLPDLASAAAVPASVAPRTHDAIAAAIASGCVPDLAAPTLRESRLVHATPWRSLVEDRLEAADGGVRSYAYLAVPRAVFVVATTDDGDMLFVRQYRHPVRDFTLEVPAGAVEDGEAPIAAARRELAEEVGATGGDWRHLTTFFSSSAHLSLRSDVFLAVGVRVGTARPDVDEDLRTVRIPVADAIARARAGAMAEGQTALAVILAAAHLVTGP